MIGFRSSFLQDIYFDFAVGSLQHIHSFDSQSSAKVKRFLAFTLLIACF